MGREIFRIRFAAEVCNATGRPVPLTRAQPAIEVWALDADDALNIATRALDSLIDAERDGEIQRKDPPHSG